MLKLYGLFPLPKSTKALSSTAWSSVAALPRARSSPRRRRFSPSMGWKAFWSEILIVVLGVAIALAAAGVAGVNAQPAVTGELRDLKGSVMVLKGKDYVTGTAGMALATGERGRETPLLLGGQGFYRLSVIDAEGRSAAVTVTLR